MKDVHGNETTIQFSITSPTGGKAENPFHKPGAYFFPDSVNTFLKSKFQILLEPGCFYEPLQYVYRADSVTKTNYLSATYQFGEYSVPVQKKFDVRIKAPDFGTDFPYYKLGIGLISDRGNLSFIGGNYVDGWVESRPRSFGKYVLTIDSIPPVIKPLDFNNGKVISKYRTLELAIQDNLSGVLFYKAFLNDQWVIMIYDRKKRRYIIPLDERSKPHLKSGQNQVKIWTEDAKGNEVEKSYNIVY